MTILEELVRTHGGQRAKDEYKKLVEENKELKHSLAIKKIDQEGCLESARRLLKENFELQQDKTRLIEALTETTDWSCNCYVNEKSKRLLKEMEGER